MYSKKTALEFMVFSLIIGLVLGYIIGSEIGFKEGFEFREKLYDDFEIINIDGYTILRHHEETRYLLPKMTPPPPKDGIIPTLVIDELNCKGTFWDCARWEYKDEVIHYNNYTNETIHLVFTTG